MNKMNELEVKQLVGDKWELFQEFMRGQTVEIYSDGTLNYYPQDVQRFINLKWIQ